MMKKSQILNSKAIDHKINRLAWQIYENNLKEKDVVIVGISGRGEILANLLSEVLNHISSIKIKLGVIHLDKDNPYNSQITTNLKEIDYSNKVVILVDDVLNSGKTLIYASKYFLTTPLVKLSTVVLIERKHNLFPIKANYVGLSLATTLQQYITVSLERDSMGVYLS
tara:strand:+ start:198 stop:701 length:504 start_codon:yes stop_codon:yes gene_type:complete